MSHQVTADAISVRRNCDLTSIYLPGECLAVFQYVAFRRSMAARSELRRRPLLMDAGPTPPRYSHPGYLHMHTGPHRKLNLNCRLNLFKTLLGADGMCRLLEGEFLFRLYIEAYALD